MIGFCDHLKGEDWVEFPFVMSSDEVKSEMVSNNCEILLIWYSFET